jgi:hypothetical protein
MTTDSEEDSDNDGKEEQRQDEDDDKEARDYRCTKLYNTEQNIMEF